MDRQQDQTFTSVEASPRLENGSSDAEKQNSHHLAVEAGGYNEKETHEVVGSLENPHVDAIAEARFLKKMDYRMVPLLFVLYMMSYLDRSNIGNAKIAGMSKALRFSANGNDYSWLLTIFYIGYILFEPLILMWRVCPAHIWVAIMVFGWGLFATLQSATTSWSGMMTLRFLLGAVEAGVGPGIPLYLSFFYQRHEIGLRLGLVLSAAPVATCFAGALAYGITSGHPSIANWRLLLLVEGLPCFVLWGFALFYLPDSPSTAKFFSEEDQGIVNARATRQIGRMESGSRGTVGGIVWSEIGAGLLNPRNYITAMMYFSCNVSFSSLPVFLPTIINEMGFSAIHAQGLSAPPYFLATIFVIITTFIADRYGQRGIVTCISSLLGAIGYILLAATSRTAIRYFAVYLAAPGIFAAIINVIPWVTNNQDTDTKRGAGLGLWACPYYRLGMWTCAAFMILVAVLAMVLRAVLKWENGRMDEKYGKLEKVGKVGLENDGPNFRYIL